jgi:Protein of unknown function (DUF1360)
VANPLQHAARETRARYEGGDRRPLQGYVAAIGAYAAAVGVVVGLGKATGVHLPERFGLGDTVLLCIATHKASRLLAKDPVASPIRAPFTQYEEPAGMAELNESVRGRGVQHAVGELLSCPFCLGVWTSSALTAGMVFAPRATRVVNTILTAVAASDTMQIAYDASKQLPERVAD